MDNLIAELERATEGSRELDALIDLALKRGQPYKPARIGQFIDDYTTSLDAALTLVPEGWDWLARDGDGGHFANVTRGGIPMMMDKHQFNPDWQDTPTYAATPALALCIASLKARQAMKEAG